LRQINLARPRPASTSCAPTLWLLRPAGGKRDRVAEDYDALSALLVDDRETAGLACPFTNIELKRVADQVIQSIELEVK
jgi:hypothetical protein